MLTLTEAGAHSWKAAGEQKEQSMIRCIKLSIVAMIFLVIAVGICGAGESASDINLDVKEFTLDNGMLFLVVERPAMPQIACRLAIRAGSALEEASKTGIAHLLEHMMFKGTKNFGTLDLKRDQELQAQTEAAYQVVREEKLKRKPNQALIDSKLSEIATLRAQAQQIYVPQAFSSQLGRNGAVDVNAFTSTDQTQYLVSVPSDMLEQWFSIVSEQIFEPSWREFYVEKEVVQREWAFRYVNDPEGAAWLDLNATAYTAHPYRNPIIGWKSDMERYCTQDAVAFHTRYYNPTNAVCVLVGDVKLEKAKELAKTYFERYPAGRRAPEQVTAEPRQEGPRNSVRFLKGARTPLVLIGFHAARMGTDAFYALDAMTMILSQGRGARLTQQITNKGLAVGAWAYNPDNRYAGMVILGGSPNEPKDLKNQGLNEEERRRAYLRACEDLEKTLLMEVEQLKSDLVSLRELERIKKLNQREFLERMRSNEALAGVLATLEVQVGWEYLKTYLERIAQVTPEQIRQAVQEYILNDNKTSVYVIPGGEPDEPPEHYTEVRSVHGPATAPEEHPKDFRNNSIYPTPQGWKHPLSFDRKPKKIEYPEADTAQIDGATVFYLPDRELPLIDVQLLIKAGTVDVDEKKTDLAQVLNGSLIRGGTEQHGPGDLAMILDENAIEVSFSAGEEETAVSLSVLKEDWGKGLALLEEILLQPRFDPEILDATKEQILVTLARQGEDARVVSGREWEIWHFQGHPYGRDPLEGLETIPAITREDLKGFLETYCVPSNMVVAVSGDIEKEKVLQDLKGFFQALPQRKAPERTIKEPDETPPVIALIHKPGQVQSQVTFGLRGIQRTHPAYWKLSLLSDIFGGVDSLMYKRLREELGLVYAAWFYQTYKWKAGILMGYIGCKGDQTSEAIHETVNIMSSLQKDIPEKTFEQKQLDVLNSFVFNVDSPAALVSTYGRYAMRNEPLDTLDRIQDAYINANAEELEGLAEEFLHPDKLQIFVVGDKTTKVANKDGDEVTLEEDLQSLADTLGIPYKEIALR